MQLRPGSRLAAIGAFLAVAGALTAAIWGMSLRTGTAQLAQRGASDLALAADRLTGALSSYRELAVLMADHPQVRAGLTGTPGDLEALLRRTADMTGTLDLIVVAPDGSELAAAGGIAAGGRADAPYLQRAFDGAIGLYHTMSQRYGRRAFLFAAPVFSEEGPVIGAVVAVADAGMVEAEWRGDRPAVLFTDELGIVFISNRSELVFTARDTAPALTGRSAAYPPDLIRPFPERTERMRGGHDIWRLDAGRYVPARALHLTLPMPQIDMTGEALLDMAPVRAQAGLQAGLAAALFLAFGALLFLATERRRTLAEANRRLEDRVAQRTAELQALNRDLTREVGERRVAEAQLKKAQEDLVQAGKLSALGQMSAGISHELNQPLMAIQSYAENAGAFLERGKPDVAGQNLGRIADLARRMGRIIRNLRAFARQESEAIGDVDLGAVITAVIEMVEARAARSGITVDWTPPPAPVIVRGGEVRLQQVVLNLVGNAFDAMEEAPVKRVELHVDRDGDRVVLTVRDTGPGIAEPDRMFDPFYTTKTVGASEGMGLGLSISYGLVQSFGGQIRGRNHPGGGAVMTVELDAAREGIAA